MKQLLLAFIIGLIIVSICLPYGEGRKEYVKALSTIKYLSQRPENDCSDACIEETLYYYGFDIDCMETPTFKDYYIVGYRKLFNIKRK